MAVSVFLQVYESVHVRASVCVCLCVRASVCVCVFSSVSGNGTNGERGNSRKGKKVFKRSNGDTAAAVVAVVVVDDVAAVVVVVGAAPFGIMLHFC